MKEQTATHGSGDQVRRLQRLLDAAMLLNSSLSLQDLTTIILEIVRADVPVERVTAFRVDRERQEVQSLVAQETNREIRLPIGSGIAGTVAATGVELDIPAAYADSRFNPAFDGILNFRTEDLLALPVFNRDGVVVGVLELINRKRPINESDLAFLRGISTFVGLAVENAWLYQQALAKQKLEEQLLDIRDRLANIERITMMVQILSGVIREISNPLAIAMGNLGLLKDELGANTQYLAHLLAVELAIDRTATAVRHFVHLAVDQGGGDQPADLQEVLRQVVELRSRERTRLGISTTVDLRPTPLIRAQGGQLQLALLHLLINAEEAAVQNPVQARISVRAIHDNAQHLVRIEIEDNGPGISRTARDLVFKPFFTTKPAGTATGFGLTAVRNIVERHQGRVWFKTEKQKGTTFIVELPERA
jgi:signal transduction histidine kinase